jgi:hypothetical protein
MIILLNPGKAYFNIRPEPRLSLLMQRYDLNPSFYFCSCPIIKILRLIIDVAYGD